MTISHSSASRSRDHRCLPQVEQLEDRLVPALAWLGFHAGVLTFSTDGAQDRVLIEDNGSQGPGNVRVTIGGTQVFWDLVRHVNAIFYTDNGNSGDTVEYRLT